MYKPTIGLEIHVQLSTKTKLFCSCSTEFAKEPNTQVCPVCLGLPGVLPILNEKAVEYGLKLALSMNMSINVFSNFYRKNYFYPDLPKGYQITQYGIPLGRDGFLEIHSKNGIKRIGIQKGHIEEDSGKSIHIGDITESQYSFIDFNRSGIPLMEIVTEPDLESGDEAYEFLVLLRSIVRTLGVSTGDMEKGALRCDVNISVSKYETKGTKVEIKNLNSFKSVKRAIEYEIERQINAIENGERVIQETRHFDEKDGSTKPMRVKEELNDYRYFPEPDLPPLILKKDYIESLRISLPELPSMKEQRFVLQYGLPEDYARSIAYSPKMSEYFEKIIKVVNRPKEIANFIMVNISGYLNEKNLEVTDIEFDTDHFKELFEMIDNKEISLNIAKSVIDCCLKENKKPKQVVAEKGLIQIADEDFLKSVILEVIEENSIQVEQYLSGKEKVFGFLVGAVMKKTQGKANPEATNRLLKEELEKHKNRR